MHGNKRPVRKQNECLPVRAGGGVCLQASTTRKRFLSHFDVTVHLGAAFARTCTLISTPAVLSITLAASSSLCLLCSSHLSSSLYREGKPLQNQRAWGHTQIWVPQAKGQRSVPQELAAILQLRRRGVTTSRKSR